MDIQKEKDLYLAELLEREVITQDEFRDLVFKPEINAFDSNYLSSRFIDKINFGLSAWQAAKALEAKKLEGCVVVPKDQTEDWYLDDNANMWITEPDEWLCDLYVGEVQSVEHKEYLITKSDTLYAAIVWDDENQDSGTWEFFKTEEEAEKAAAHCKAMLEAARGGNE